ncbi:MAG TPA: hypothetical protein VN032_09695 [Thermoanaerobaculia bacterium]|jgi:hypothetical protein|nr:hypothetical protein [Thermoanaerobaculia bacterium]
MKRWEAWWNHAALAAVSLSGLAYGIFKYWVVSPDADSRMGHPWQPFFLKAHVLVAPFAVFGVGLLLRRHAFARLRQGEQKGRKTGTLLLWLFLPLALTGYLVQVFVEAGTLRATGWIHAGLGVLFLLGYAVHPKRRAPGSYGGNGDDADTVNERLASRAQPL